MSTLNETSFKNSDVNVFKMTNEQKACLVALYYARLHSDDEEYKGVTNKLSVIADKLGMSYNSLHNYQQQLDPFFENGRKGWGETGNLKRNGTIELRNTLEKYKEYPMEKLKELVDSLLKGRDVFEFNDKEDLSMEKQINKTISFADAVEIINSAAESTSVHFEADNYDGVIVKELKATNTLDPGRDSTGQTHIAITGEQMDMFPYVRLDGYFEKPYEVQDNGLKKYMVAQIPVHLSGNNLNYLSGDTKNSDIKVYASVVRSKRKGQADQLQISMITMDSPEFVNFRKLCVTGTYLIMLKKKGELMYEAVGIKAVDATDDLKKLNNHFYKDQTSYTLVRLDELTAKRNAKPKKEMYVINQFPDLQPRKDAKYPLNQILYGAPGTGKTYATAQYAVAILENADVNEISKTGRDEVMQKYNQYKKNGRIVFTTFHQNYGYEDFVQGIRPDTSSEDMRFQEVDGIFKRIADKAMDDPNNNYVLIIDEINRANISKTFGELITLIEEDKRWGEVNAIDIVLPSGEPFAVPNNLYIVGTMNSADKSISLIDAALRRRFEFVEFVPNLELVRDEKLSRVLYELNGSIENELGGTDLLIGHSYFMNKTENDLEDIMNHNVIPLLYEYYFDEKKKVANTLEKALNDLGYKIESESMGRIKIKKIKKES